MACAGMRAELPVGRDEHACGRRRVARHVPARQ
jgi:hypothetical protein